MPDLLRVISKAKWLRPTWLAAGEIPADAVSDLRTQDNTLSVWAVEADHSNVGRVVTAMAAMRVRLDKLDYTVVGEDQVRSLDIACVAKSMETPDAAVNGLHRDLDQLSGSKVLRLAAEMMPLERRRLSERQVRELLLASLQAGVLDRAQIKGSLLQQLEPPQEPERAIATMPPLENGDASHDVHAPSRPARRGRFARGFNRICLAARLFRRAFQG